MSEIQIKLPLGAAQTGKMLPRFEVDELDQDILQVSLSNGFIIDVGWFPEYDKSGSFQILVYRGSWYDADLGPITAKDPYEAARLIEELAQRYSGRVRIVPTPQITQIAQWAA